MKVSFIFNSDVSVKLIPEDKDDEALLNLTFLGKSVKDIKLFPSDNSVAIILSKSETLPHKE